MAMDGLQSFSYLVDNLPHWIEKLDALSIQVAERHAEFEALARVTNTRAPSLRKNKTGSMESLRPREEADNVPEPPSTVQTSSTTPKPSTVQSPSTPPVRVDINPDSKRLFQDYRLQAKRKRTSASLLSAASGTQKFRSQMSLIVFYDSAIQENFEMLVRNISSARNNLRKGKTSASFKARLAGMGMEESPSVGNRAGYATRESDASQNSKPQGPEGTERFSLETFDTVDKELEAAQTLCEVGAHQFLRDGMCTNELSGTRERFDKILETAKEQRAVFEALEKEQRLDQEQKFESSTSSDDSGVRMDYSHRSGSGVTSCSSILVDPGIPLVPPVGVDTTCTIDPEVKVDSPIAIDQADGVESAPAAEPAVAVDPLAIDGDAGNIQIDSSKPSGAALEIDQIEVDENASPVDYHIDLAAFRRSRRR